MRPPALSTKARANPSPPSASGTFRTAAAGMTRRIPSAMQFAAAWEEILPLKPEGHTRTLMWTDMRRDLVEILKDFDLAEGGEKEAGKERS